jgi:cysteine-rich repeat protein
MMFFRRCLLAFALVSALVTGVGRFAIPVAHAQEITSGLEAVGETIKLPDTDPRVIAVRIINVALGLIGIILVSLIIYAGFVYMTSGGEAEKTTRAKKIITNSIIGLVIILSAWAITRFVIERLLTATTDGTGGVGGSGGGGPGGGFGGGGGGQPFVVKSVTPTGNVSIRNVQVKIVFNKPVDEASASGILVSKVGGTTVGGTVDVVGSLITFTPAEDCPAPNQDKKCFEGDSDFEVTVGSSVRSVQGQLVTCSGLGSPCQAQFHTGNLVDVAPPAVSMTYPVEGQSVPQNFLQDLEATATDDSGVATVEFFDGVSSIDLTGPTQGSPLTPFNAQGIWNTTAVALGVHTLSAAVSDIDTNSSQSSSRTVVVRPEHCFNGIQDDPLETGVDCGGDPSSQDYCGACSGGSCTNNSQCSSGFCVAGQCVARPVIQNIAPLNGQPGTFVTLKGINFGSSAGTVTFLGAAGAQDDVVALPPAVCVSAGVNTWSNIEAIVAVPTGAVSGPIRISNAQSGLADESADDLGPVMPNFLVDNTVHPGLCGLNPSSGYVGTETTAIGQGFGGSAGTIGFGATTLNAPFPEWTDESVRFQVPVMNTAQYPVVVRNGSEESNPVTYSVTPRSLGATPFLATVDPVDGPNGAYITLSGDNFGWSPGTVVFTNAAGEAIGDTSFPPACGSGYWRNQTVIVKVPFQLTNGQAVSDGSYQIKIKRTDLAESNQLDFSVNSQVPSKPGICAIIPAAGPIGTDARLVGEGFGSQAPSVTFTQNQLAIVGNYANQEVQSTVPSSALTGPVFLTTAANQTSNRVNFQVRNCNEAPADICNLGTEQCCSTGECRLQNEQCGVVALSSEYAWQTSTGLIPVAPRVIEECRPDLSPAPTPSPSPWLGRAGGDQAPIDAVIVTRFTHVLDPATITPASFRVLRCTSNSNEPCTTTETVPFSIFANLENNAQQVVRLTPSNSFVTNTTYLVQVTTDVKANGPGGANMDPVPSCGTSSSGETYGYCFRFRTRASTEPSGVGVVNVIPSPYTMTSSGETAPYQAVPLSASDQCIVLDCRPYDWSWYTGSSQQNPDSRAAISNNQMNGRGMCEQVATGLLETGQVPVDINAQLVNAPIGPGVGKLYVTFVPPHVEAYSPNCNEACINALAWARFSGELDEQTVQLPGNVVIQKCYNENCVEAELAPPIDPSSLEIDLIPAFGQGGAPRVITISPLGSNQQLLLEPGGFYRVLLKGGPNVPDGITGQNGVPINGLNHPLGFTWSFRVKTGVDAVCATDRVDVVPLEKYETVVNARQVFIATPFGAPDSCSADGQALVQTQSANWTTSDASVANLYLVNGGLIDTGGELPLRCTGTCLAAGASAEFGKVGVCGNGVIETTDANYCVGGVTPAGTACTLMSPGARAGEQCEPLLNGGGCSQTSCLWLPVALASAGGTCGNGVLDAGAGESCDFGVVCLGGSSATSSPPVAEYAPCLNPAAQTACLQAGGTCTVAAYRGCSSSCRHLGSVAGGSTCGISDPLGDGKDCDDGNLTSGDGCSALCLHEGTLPASQLPSVCGNAVLEPGEVCERPTLNAPFPAGCNVVSCVHTGTISCGSFGQPNCCGNGNLDAGEDCDDSNTQSNDSCDSSCLLEGSSAAYSNGLQMAPSFCGNGIIEKGEMCDVGASTEAVVAQVGYGTQSADVTNAYGMGAGVGDGLFDAKQLAFIVGAAIPDAAGKMSSTLTALLEGKNGTATYGLQCGFTDEASCPAGFGLDDAGCCSLRPAVQTKYPNPGATGVCRNVQISGIFNVPMNSGSVVANFEVTHEIPSADSCPAGTTEVLVMKTYGPGFWNWLKKTWDHVIAWTTGVPAYAQKYCKGNVTGQLEPVNSSSSTKYVFTLDKALASDTTYRIRFVGDTSDSVSPLADNADLSKKLGVKSARGVVHEPEPGPTGDLVWTFRTGTEICTVNVVRVTDVTPVPPPPDVAHPYLFINKGNQPEDRSFEASAQSVQNDVAVPLSPVAEYSWMWLPWTTSDDTIVTVAGVQPGNVGTSDSSIATSAQKNGNAILTASLEITADSVNVPSTTQSGLQGIAPVSVLVCENPWPLLTGSPFRDSAPNGPIPSSFEPGDPFYAGPFFNFSSMYCRDAGQSADTTDDLPSLVINQVPKTPLDDLNGILRQYLFTYPAETDTTPAEYRGLQKDGIGIRIASNPQHLSPVEWYRSKGFLGNPERIFVDGYPAIRDGNTIYVAASNRGNPSSGPIYSNIYVISRNPDAKPVTVSIYDQMANYLAFNINILNQSNVCVRNSNSLVYTDANVNGGAPVKCSADYECFAKTGQGNLHCDSLKLKLTRDTQRMADFQSISAILETSKDAQGRYPRADAGTFLRGFSNSLWSSWGTEMAAAVGQSLPFDPVNRFLSCGRCSVSGAPCQVKADCSNDADVCEGGSYLGGSPNTWTPNPNIDPQTCWNQTDHQFICPRAGSPIATRYGASRLYQYHSLVGGQRFELGSEFEVPPVNLNNWWTPPLPEAIYKCVTTSTQGVFCSGANGQADDALCRSCPNPALGSCRTCQGGAKNGQFCASASDCGGNACSDTTPVVAGACRQFGGSFVYEDICRNTPYGESGICGDGVLNTQANPPEVCEIGETRSVSCTVNAQPGFKQQICNPDTCGGFIDDVQNPQCVAGVSCGNGRVDRGCGGDPSDACLVNADCPVNVQCLAVESCDDGALNGTYGKCSTSCQGPASYCGDGQLSPGEICDEGPSNGVDGNGDYESSCNLSCQGVGPYCGNQEVDGPEECDGNSLTSTGKICRTGIYALKKTCNTNADCAGGICGGTTATNSCEGVMVNVGGIDYPTQHTRTCRAPGTANQCDWFNWSSCQAIGSCGDGIKDLNEQCDAGAQNSDTGACTASCKLNVCGDNKVNLNVEECDAGDQNGQVTCSADYDSMCLSCSNQCKFQASAGGYCGDNIKNGPEQCDGAQPSVKPSCTALGFDYSKSPGGQATCTSSCSFGNCARCSDEPGTGVIEGRVLDAIFQQVVPGARVSLLYKGTKVDEAFADTNGYFQFSTLNTNAACSGYRLVVDFYQDNPCTSTDYPVSCFAGSVPPFTYPEDIDEGDTGGYFPFTSPVFSTTNAASIFNIPAGESVANVYLFPRPSPGKGYVAVTWATLGANDANFDQFRHLHVILPENKAYTTTDFTENPEDSVLCDYNDRPAAGGACTRDVTFGNSQIGSWNIDDDIPYARSICLHRLGEKSKGSSNPANNGCPIEGTTACLANHPDNDSNLSVAQCGSGGNANNPVCIACGADQAHSCSADGAWDSCWRVSYGPVATLINVARYKNSAEKISLYFNGLYDSSANFKSRLRNSTYKYKAYVALTSYTPGSQAELIEVDPLQRTSAAMGTGYAWHIGNILPYGGSSFESMNYLAGADSDANPTGVGQSSNKPTAGFSCFRYQFQCAGAGAYCTNSSNDDLVKATPQANMCFWPEEQASCTGSYSCGVSWDTKEYHLKNY